LFAASAYRRKTMTDRIERQEVEEQAAEFVEELSDEALDRPPIVAWTSCSHGVLGPKKTGAASKKPHKLDR
jgi:hypothetical protein